MLDTSANNHKRNDTNSSYNSNASFESSSARLEYKPQSPDERYALPENFLEVEVTNPQAHGPDASSSQLFTDYEIICRVRVIVDKQDGYLYLILLVFDFKYLILYLILF